MYVSGILENFVYSIFIMHFKTCEQILLKKLACCK